MMMWTRWMVVAGAVGVLVGPVGAQSGPVGPTIEFFGLIRADDTLVEPSEQDPGGVPIFQRPFGSGFSLVVEAKRGSSGKAVGPQTFDEEACPDLQVQVSRPLGNGSEAVCDKLAPEIGGVPATDPIDLGDAPGECGRLNDLGCRFVDGKGGTDEGGRSCGEGCVLFPSGEQGCVSAAAERQFCGAVAGSLSFPVGDTVVTARVRDVDGNLGPTRQIIVRILPPVRVPMPSDAYDASGDGCAIARGRVIGGPAWIGLVGALMLLGRRRRR